MATVSTQRPEARQLSSSALQPFEGRRDAGVALGGEMSATPLVQTDDTFETLWLFFCGREYNPAPELELSRRRHSGQFGSTRFTVERSTLLHPASLGPSSLTSICI
ncbi:hypothetical protein EYF80_021025 [Liparis tanakae]|uniref:Uncharacterized protein n=1 Tax=Liparis tanakae TaxID=230148 RepID=A0A4Z2HUS6_9TELE|nr:hypothetical protein EYF80_021025 [Liparis tanakae]